MLCSCQIEARLDEPYFGPRRQSVLSGVGEGVLDPVTAGDLHDLVLLAGVIDLVALALLGVTARFLGLLLFTGHVLLLVRNFSMTDGTAERLTLLAGVEDPSPPAVCGVLKVVLTGAGTNFHISEANVFLYFGRGCD